MITFVRPAVLGFTEAGALRPFQDLANLLEKLTEPTVEENVRPDPAFIKFETFPMPTRLSKGAATWPAPTPMAFPKPNARLNSENTYQAAAGSSWSRVFLPGGAYGLSFRPTLGG